MERIKRFIKTALTYLAGNLLSKIVTFFLIPLYSNKLTPAEYGDYDVVTTIVSLLVSVAFFQIWDGMFRMSFDFSEKGEKLNIISICLKGYGIAVIIYSVFYYIIMTFVMNQKFVILPYIFGITFGLQFMYSFSARVFLRNKLFVFSGAASTLVIALINVILILYFNMGVQALFIAQIVGCLVQILIIELELHLTSNLFSNKFDVKILKNVLKFSVPLCVATISYWLLTGFTKIVINRFCGLEENGLFAIASSLANVAVIAVNVFQFAWNEMAYLMANEVNRSVTYKKCLDLLFCTVWVCCAAFCSFISVIFPYYIGKAFQSSLVVIPYLMIGVSANAIAGFLGTLFMTERKTNFIMISTFLAAAVNIVFCVFATQTFGLTGAVLVLSLSFIVLMILRLIQIKREINVVLSNKMLFSLIPVAMSVFMTVFKVSPALNIGYIFLLIICYIILLQKYMGIPFKRIMGLK